MKFGEIPESGADTFIMSEGKTYVVQFASDEAEVRDVKGSDGSTFKRYVFSVKIDNQDQKLGLSAFTVSQIRKQLQSANKKLTEAKFIMSVSGTGRQKRVNVNILP